MYPLIVSLIRGYGNVLYYKNKTRADLDDIL